MRATIETNDFQPIADELAIRNVLALIAQHSDDCSLDAYGALFTDDARWEMPGVPLRKGRKEIVAAGAERRAAGVTGPGSHSRHVVTTVAVTVDGDEAVARSYWQFYTDTDTAPALRSMGKYRDTFRRTADGWRLRHRHITTG
jgi:uncharacterized protein (TIGR02246 family)